MSNNGDADDADGSRRELAFILLVPMLALSILPITSGAGLTTLPLSFTFIIKAPALNTYQAFVTGGNPMIPLFQEANLSQMINNDILASSQCAIGCSMTWNPGPYNLTQGIFVSNSQVGMSGSFGSIITAQNATGGGVFSSNVCGTRPMICVTGNNFFMDGLTWNDRFRDGIAGVSGDAVDIAASAKTGLIRSTLVVNASSNGVEILGQNYVVQGATISSYLPHISGGNFGILIGGTAAHIRAFLNMITEFNGSDVSGIQQSNGATDISLIGNSLSKNSFGITTTCGKILSIIGNTITNNYAAGMLLTTLGFGGPFACGPASISGNTIENNGQEPNVDGQCISTHCGGIELRSAKCCWDTVSISGANTIKDTQTVPTQKVAIHFGGTVSCAAVNCYSNVTIAGNSFGRTSSGTILNLTIAPTASWIIDDNRGFNPQPVRGPLTAGATPFTYTNNDGYREQIEIITTGDMTSFTCRGIAEIIQVDAISPILNPADTCGFSYVVTAPTYDVLPT